MTQTDAAAGFTRGFFGVFGALAAVAAIGIGVVAMGGLAGDGRRAEEAATRAAMLSPASLAARCGEAAAQAQARYEIGPVTASGAPAQVEAGPSSAPSILCSATSSRGPVLIRATVSCATPTTGSCALVQGATLNGVRLAMR